MSTYELMSSSPTYNIGQIVYNKGVAMSSTGKYIAICLYGGAVYISNDYCINLNQVSGIPTGANWTSITMSSTGQYMAACIYVGSGSNSGIYVSNNYGANGSWVHSSTVITEWSSIAISSSGQYIAVCVSGASYPGYYGIFVNNNYGVESSWIRVFPYGAYWNSIAVSSSGQYMAVCSPNSSTSIYYGIYVSNNYGVNWSRVNGVANWSSIAMSSSGQYIVACIISSTVSSLTGIYLSENYGSGWNQLVNSQYFTSIAMSSSGQYIAACIDDSSNNGIYISNDTGSSNWFQLANNQHFSSIAMSSSGQKISTFQDNPSYTLYNYNLYNTNVSPVITHYFGILQNYNFSLNPGSYYINIIDPQTTGFGGTGNIYIFNLTSGYSTYLLFRSIYNSTDITQNQIYILNDPTLFHDTNIAIYFSYINGTVTITNISTIICYFIVTVQGSFNYNLPQNIIENAGSVPGSSLPINFQ